MEDDSSHYSQQQKEYSWDSMKYTIDPTLGNNE